jgi:hypothetical protein
MSTSSADVFDRHVYILARWQEYEGEARANLLRIIGIGAFYGVELLNYYGLHLGVIEMPRLADRQFHQAVTALAVVWTMIGLGVLLCLRQRFFPASLKYLTTAGDLVLLTAVLVLASGPRSPLVAGYFLVIALAGLRFSLPLVWFASGGAMLGYVFLCGYAKWFTTQDLRVPRYHQLIVLVALALAGVMLGQILRRTRGLLRDLAVRLEGQEGEVP